MHLMIAVSSVLIGFLVSTVFSIDFNPQTYNVAYCEDDPTKVCSIERQLLHNFDFHTNKGSYLFVFIICSFLALTHYLYIFSFFIYINSLYHRDLSLHSKQLLLKQINTSNYTKVFASMFFFAYIAILNRWSYKYVELLHPFTLIVGVVSMAVVIWQYRVWRVKTKDITGERRAILEELYRDDIPEDPDWRDVYFRPLTERVKGMNPFGSGFGGERGNGAEG
mmetsp:Transcript_26648/g.30616  ORF Transcript_26648/g.30616 Transcript_26648/m.30616 type:complete len:222 (+) Transcript_26648:260-925(+)